MAGRACQAAAWALTPLIYMLRDAVLRHFEEGEAPQRFAFDGAQDDFIQIWGYVPGKIGLCLKSGKQSV